MQAIMKVSASIGEEATMNAILDAMATVQAVLLARVEDDAMREGLRMMILDTVQRRLPHAIAAAKGKAKSPVEMRGAIH